RATHCPGTPNRKYVIAELAPLSLMGGVQYNHGPKNRKRRVSSSIKSRSTSRQRGRAAVMERVAAMGVMLLVVLLLGSCRKDRSDVTPPAASSSPSSTAQEETAIRPEVVTPQAAPRVLSESQATAVKLANDVLMWLERYRATFVDGSLATHRAFYDTDH